MFRWALVYKRNLATNEMEPHPSFLDRTGKPAQLRQFDIEIISNLVEYNCGSHLACRDYNKTTVFCRRQHRGLDEPGIASRRGEDGEFFLTVCDPQRCDLRINQVNNNSKITRIKEKWGRLYKEATLSGVNKKNQLEAAKCRYELFFIFRLLTPEGEYAHASSEFCLFSSHAESNHRIHRKLMDLHDAMNGRIAGLRLKLVYDEVSTVYGKDKKPAWNLFAEEGSDINELRRQALERRVEQQTALARVGDQTALARMVEEDPDILSMAFAEQRRAAQIKAEQGDPQEAGLFYFNPFVREVCDRLDLTNLWISTLPMIAKGNMARFIYWAQQQAADYTFTPYGSETPIKEPRSIDDILQKYGWLDLPATEPIQPEVGQDQAAALPATTVCAPTGPIDAEFTEEEEFDAEAATAAVRGEVRQVPLSDFGAPSPGALFPDDPITKLPGEEGFQG